jgi:hypothetical protein
MPGSAAFYGSFFAKPAKFSRELMCTVFEPAGHFRAVAEAPGTDRLVHEYRQAVDSGGALVGALLTIVAILAVHHPGTPASLNRALAVVQGCSDRGIMKAPSDRTLLSMWMKRRHLAPLWASVVCSFQVMQAQGLASFETQLEALHSPTRFSEMLGYAKWFRSFAVSFVPDHATAPLIPPCVAMEIAARVPEIKPKLAVLPPEVLAVAKSYRAPTRKYDT